MSVKIIVAGGRDFDDCALLDEVLDQYLENHEIEEIVSGKAKGADFLGETWAVHHDIPIKPFPAEWHKHGRGAGHVRNLKMARYADVLFAFWDGESKGTNGMIHDALHEGLEVHVYRYKPKGEHNDS